MRIKQGFSLMEMMVVLLITAIIMAASMPLITKRLTGDSVAGGNSISVGSGGECLWKILNDNDDIGYNTESKDQSVIIGGSAFDNRKNDLSGMPFYPGNPKLFINNGALAFGKDNKYLGHINLGNEIMIGAFSKSGPSNIIIGNAVNRDIPDSTLKYRENAVGIGHNTIIGNHAVAVGDLASASGDNAIAIGTMSTIPVGDLYSYTHANAARSIAIGGSAAVNSNANNAVAIGYQAMVQENNENSVAIGYGATAFKKDQIVLGHPDSTVFIPGNLVVGKNVILNGFNGRTAVRTQNGANNRLLILDGEGSNLNAADLWGHNDFKSSSFKDLKDSYYSDRRLKNVGEEYKAGLAELGKLKFFNYTFKDDKNKTPRVGVIAQDLQKVFPDAVTKDENGYLKIRMEDMFYAVVNAVKDLGKKFEELSSKVIASADKIKKLEAKVDSQQAVIESQAKLIRELQKQNASFEKRINKLEKK